MRPQGTPAASRRESHVAAGAVELLALRDRREDAKIRRRVRAAAGAPLPAERVAGEVGVHQRVPKPGRARLPGEAQVFDEE